MKQVLKVTRPIIPGSTLSLIKLYNQLKGGFLWLSGAGGVCLCLSKAYSCKLTRLYCQIEKQTNPSHPNAHNKSPPCYLCGNKCTQGYIKDFIYSFVRSFVLSLPSIQSHNNSTFMFTLSLFVMLKGTANIPQSAYERIYVCMCVCMFPVSPISLSSYLRGECFSWSSNCSVFSAYSKAFFLSYGYGHPKRQPRKIERQKGYFIRCCWWFHVATLNAKLISSRILLLLPHANLKSDNAFDFFNVKCVTALKRPCCLQDLAKRTRRYTRRHTRKAQANVYVNAKTMSSYQSEIKANDERLAY